MSHFPTFVDGLPLTRRAFEFATERHEGQRRKADDAAFILHPLEVAQLLRATATRTRSSPRACSTTASRTPMPLRSSSSSASAARSRGSCAR